MDQKERLIKEILTEGQKINIFFDRRSLERHYNIEELQELKEDLQK